MVQAKTGATPAQAVLGPYFQYREAESPRCGNGGRGAAGGGGGLGHAERALSSGKGAAGNFFVRPPTQLVITVYQLLEVWQRLCRYRLPVLRSSRAQRLVRWTKPRRASPQPGLC